MERSLMKANTTLIMGYGEPIIAREIADRGKSTFIKRKTLRSRKELFQSTNDHIGADLAPNRLDITHMTQHNRSRMH